MARMGNWRDNKDDEIKLDGIGGVNIMVKADVHRSGMCFLILLLSLKDHFTNARSKASISQPTPSKTKPKQKDSLKWLRGLGTEYMACQIMLFGILILRKSPETVKHPLQI